MMALLANAILFQGVWLLNVLELNPVAVLATVAAAMVHLGLTYYFDGRSACVRESMWLATVTSLGWLLELGFSIFGLLVHDPRSDALFGVPFWLILLWLAFATTIRFSLGFLRDKYSLAAVIGLVAVFSYWGGAALNQNSSMGAPVWWSCVVIALVWACVLPALVKLHQRFVL